MKLQYYGTAAAEGWPGLFCQCETCRLARKLGGKNLRSRAQAVVDDALLLDFGPDTGLHALRDGMPLHRLRHCLITHGHSDHFYPADLVMKAGVYAPTPKGAPLHLYGSDWVRKLYEEAMDRENDTNDLAECVCFHPVQAGETFLAGEYEVTALAASHSPPEPCLIYRIKGPEGKALLYAHDTAWFPEETWALLAGVPLDLVSLDCTLGTQGEGSTHMGLEGCRKTRERMLREGIAGPETRFVINHFSHNGWPGFSHEAMEQLAGPDGFAVAWDGMTVQL